MENTEQKAVNEIDLIELSGKALKLMGTFFTWTALLAQQIFVFLVRKIVWFAVCMGAMLVFSYAVYRTQKPVYSTMMVAKMNVLDNSFAISHINGAVASNLRQAFNRPDTSLARHIKSVAACWGVSYFRRDYRHSVDMIDFKWEHVKPLVRKDSFNIARVWDRFFVQVSVYDKAVQPYLTKGLVDNICSIPHVQELNEIRKNQRQERIAKLNRQIQVLDSLQYYDYFVKDAKIGAASPAMGSIMLLSEPDAAPQTHRIRITEKTFFHEEIMKLHAERQALESDLLVDSAPITVIQGFETNLQRESSYSKVAKRMLIFGFFIALAATLAWDNRKWLAEIATKKQ